MTEEPVVPFDPEQHVTSTEAARLLGVRKTNVHKRPDMIPYEIQVDQGRFWHGLGRRAWPRAYVEELGERLREEREEPTAA